MLQEILMYYLNEICIMQKSKSFVHILPTKEKHHKKKAKEVEDVEKF